MSNRYLARLRLARVRFNENIFRLETLLAFQRSRREVIEAAIHDLEPELKLPLPNRKPNPVFKRGEVSRLVLQIMREAGEPLAASVVAARILAAKLTCRRLGSGRWRGLVCAPRSLRYLGAG